MPVWRVICCVALLTSAVTAYGAQPYLWLPKSYKHAMPKLELAVAEVLKSPRCEQVLKGTINIDLSSIEQPVFKILCRDKERKTYVTVLEGNSLAVYDRTKSRYHRGPTERSMREYWSTCQKAVNDMYEDFRTIKVLTKRRPEPILYKDGTVGIVINFDAISLIGEPLAFRAECVFSSGTSYRLRLSGREAK